MNRSQKCSVTPTSPGRQKEMMRLVDHFFRVRSAMHVPFGVLTLLIWVTCKNLHHFSKCSFSEDLELENRDGNGLNQVHVENDY